MAINASVKCIKNHSFDSNQLVSLDKKKKKNRIKTRILSNQYRKNHTIVKFEYVNGLRIRLKKKENQFHFIWLSHYHISVSQLYPTSTFPVILANTSQLLSIQY